MIDYHLYRKNTINEIEVQFRFSALLNLNLGSKPGVHSASQSSLKMQKMQKMQKKKKKKQGLDQISSPFV